jgi:uncharacterized membrane protein
MPKKIQSTKKSKNTSSKKIQNQETIIPIKKEKIVDKAPVLNNQNLDNNQAVNQFEENKKTENINLSEIFMEEKNQDSLENKNDLEEKDVQENKYVAAFAYLSFLFIIPLFLKRRSPFCQKHAKQGLIWFVINLVLSFLFFIPVVNIIYAFIVLIITFTAIFKTLAGEYWRIPLIYKWAEKINL